MQLQRPFIQLSLLPILSTAALAESKTVWFGTSGPGIHVSNFDTETGKLSQASQASDVKSPGFLALHPKLSVLYAVCNTSGGDGVAAFEIDGTELSFVELHDSGGAVTRTCTPAGEFGCGDDGTW